MMIWPGSCPCGPNWINCSPTSGPPSPAEICTIFTPGLLSDRHQTPYFISPPSCSSYPTAWIWPYCPPTPRCPSPPSFSWSCPCRESTCLTSVHSYDDPLAFTHRLTPSATQLDKICTTTNVTLAFEESTEDNTYPFLHFLGENVDFLWSNLTSRFTSSILEHGWINVAQCVGNLAHVFDSWKYWDKKRFSKHFMTITWHRIDTENCLQFSQHSIDNFVLNGSVFFLLLQIKWR